MTTKKCSLCLKNLDIGNFNKKSGRCKPCAYIKLKERREKKRKELIGTKKCWNCHIQKKNEDFKTDRICLKCFEFGKSDVERKCIKCEIIKPSSEFYKSGRYHLYQKKCKECDGKSKTRSNCRKYTVDEHYFEKVDTQEKAYILGFLYADGYNYEKRGRVKLTLAKKDVDILHKIKECFKTNRPLYSIENKDGCYEELIFVNVKISDDLRKLGMVQAKTHILTFPDFLQEELIRHFIRGYFDGDGCLTGSYNKRCTTYFSWNVSIIGTTTFLDTIGKILKNKIDVNHNLTTRHKNSPNIKTLMFKGKNQISRFLDWIYEDSTIHLDRKYGYYQRFKKGLPKYEIGN